MVNEGWAPRGQGMHWDVNLSQISALIGTIYGMDNTVRTPVYIDALMRYAHSEAAEQFNMDAAAKATADQTLNHMYEWGTVGINKGKTTRQLSPMDPEARLWRHRIVGRGSTKQIDFTYRTSKVPVPQPTPDKTKVSQEYLDKLSGRKYIFHWKAPIIEQGVKVMLRPKYAKAIFVPFYGQPRSPRLTDRERERGFLYHKGPLMNVPGHGTIQGRDLEGNFTSFWETWWNAAGEDIIAEKMTSELTEEMRELFARAGKMGTRTRTKNWNFEIDTNAAETAAYMRRRAEGLEKKDEMESETW